MSEKPRAGQVSIAGRRRLRARITGREQEPRILILAAHWYNALDRGAHNVVGLNAPDLALTPVVYAMARGHTLNKRLKPGNLLQDTVFAFMTIKEHRARCALLLKGVPGLAGALLCRHR